MIKQSRAWLLEPLGLAPCAVAEHEIMQHLNSAPAYLIPFAPRHCKSAINWQNHLIPIMNTGPLAGDYAAVRGLAVLAYQNAPGESLQYIALAIRTAPVRILVDDQATSELPQVNNDLWQAVAKSCFCHEETPVPILDIRRLCSAEFRDFAAQRLANSPEPVMEAMVEPSAVQPQTDTSNEQVESLPAPTCPIHIRAGLLDDDDIDSVDIFDNEDDDLDSIDALDDEWSPNERDVQAHNDTDEFEDDRDLDDDALDDETWLEGEAEDMLDDDPEAESLDETDALADDTNFDDDTGPDELDDDESLDDVVWLKEEAEDMLDDDPEAESLDETDALADGIDLDDDTDLDELDNDELPDDIAWREDDDEAIFDDERELEDVAAVGTR